MGGKSALTKVLMILTIIGAINWGLVGFFNWNLVNALFGGPSRPDAGAISRIIYAIVGLAGLGLAVMMPKLRELATPHPAQRRAEA